MHTDPARAASDTTLPPRRWVSVLLVVAAVLTALNGFVVGYGAVWFQLFGSQPDREDYLVSLGGYAAAAVLLALAVAANLLREGPAGFTYAASAAALVLALAGVSSWMESRVVDDPGPGISNPWDGVGGVVALPWSWAIVLVLVLSARHQHRRH